MCIVTRYSIHRKNEHREKIQTTEQEYIAQEISMSTECKTHHLQDTKYRKEQSTQKEYRGSTEKNTISIKRKANVKIQNTEKDRVYIISTVQREKIQSVSVQRRVKCVHSAEHISYRIQNAEKNRVQRKSTEGSTEKSRMCTECRTPLHDTDYMRKKQSAEKEYRDE